MDVLRAIAHDDRRAGLTTASLVLFSGGLFILLLWANKTSLLGPTFFASAFLIGGWLYTVDSPRYLGLILWLWFLSPFIRRVIDYAAGSYTSPSRSLVLLTPFTVTLLTFVDIPRFGGKLTQRRYFPYFLCIVGVLYGYLIGLVKVGPMGTTMQLVSWLPPLLTGVYILNRSHLAEEHVQVITSTITWGVFVLGLYGILQFYFLPEWDAFWMQNADMKSIGQPFPKEVRVYSMLDSPGPFATTLGTGLIVLLAGKNVMSVVAAVPGYVSFLLANVRGAWIGWVLSVGAILLTSEGKFRKRLLALTVVIGLFTVPIAMTGSIAQKTGSRMETLENVEEDGSFQARMRLYRNAPIRILKNPVGWGLGSRNMDSGILALFWQLGWLGGGLYLSGLFLLLRRLLQGSSFYTTIVVGIAASYCIQFLAGSQLLGEVSGVLFWSLISVSVAFDATKLTRQ